MKRFLSLILTLSMLALLASCGAAAPSPQPTQKAEKTAESTVQKTDASKAIVVYFSRAGEQYKVGRIDEGNTAVVAKMAAEKTGADVFEITPAQDNYPMDSYDALIEYAKKEQADNARPEIKGDAVNFDSYDTVFLGYPIWWGDMPMIMYSFLEKHDFSGKTVIPFCTHEGSGNAGTKAKIEKALPSAKVEDVFAVRGEEAQKQRSTLQGKVDEWLKGYGY